MTLSVALGPDTQESTQTGTVTSTDVLSAPDIPWNLVIWNDPVNLMSYVSYVFRSYFGYSEAKANKLMLEVHKKGRSIVAHGSGLNTLYVSSRSVPSRSCTAHFSAPSAFQLGVLTHQRR